MWQILELCTPLRIQTAKAVVTAYSCEPGLLRGLLEREVIEARLARQNIIVGSNLQEYLSRASTWLTGNVSCSVLARICGIQICLHEYVGDTHFHTNYAYGCKGAKLQAHVLVNDGHCELGLSMREETFFALAERVRCSKDRCASSLSVAVRPMSADFVIGYLTVVLQQVSGYIGRKLPPPSPQPSAKLAPVDESVAPVAAGRSTLAHSPAAAAAPQVALLTLCCSHFFCCTCTTLSASVVAAHSRCREPS